MMGYMIAPTEALTFLAIRSPLLLSIASTGLLPGNIESSKTFVTSQRCIITCIHQTYFPYVLQIHGYVCNVTPGGSEASNIILPVMDYIIA